MDKRLLKIIGALCIGAGVGICIGIVTQDVLPAILIGLGLGLCLSVAFGKNS